MFNRVWGGGIRKSQINKTCMSPILVLRGIAVSLGLACAFLFTSTGYASLPGNLPVGREMPEAHWTEEGISLPWGEPAGGEMIAVSSEKKKEEKVEEGPFIIPVEVIVVNLSGSNARRYLKAKIHLEAKDAEGKKKIEAKAIPIKDRLISILSSKTLEDIEGLEGQESLRGEIKKNIDTILKVEGGILQVYFSEFVVQ